LRGPATDNQVFKKFLQISGSCKVKTSCSRDKYRRMHEQTSIGMIDWLIFCLVILCQH